MPMNSRPPRSNSNPSGGMLTHLASLLVLIVTLVFSIKSSVYIGENASFFGIYSRYYYYCLS
ncbi:hypothetical protein MESS2_440081 [Mesorhizobium metallidurans STM 2683]|uniref:Uncharacterized protein n=1 Tax=Mesorhizobium metallidurans STM 2683 TaxID=1297569 RepID=M5F516_9HYPH|nr:hypothetical protein MESS2_440081 [Mesorhizobium metallidurans STM 2683]